MSYIIDIGTAVPETSLTQNEFYELYSSLSDDADVKRKLRFLLSKSDIEKRHTVEPDLHKLLGQSLEEKLSLYYQQAINLGFASVINNASFDEHKNQITDLIFVSCTGMQAPGVEIALIKKLGLNPKIKRYNVTFMGCYAAITALRMADDICQRKNRTALIVSIELCSLHFQNNFEDNSLLSNSLFADGAASAIVSSKPAKSSLKMLDFESRLIPDSEHEMTWNISPSGFLMTLSADVPNTLQKSLEQESLFGLNPKETDWAIHPGGKQIINGLKNCLSLEEDVLEPSRKVLHEFGNMSSATILFVLQKKLNAVPTKSMMASCAFGPGLTLESALFEYV